MATTLITGRNLTLTIDGDAYDAQASTVTLTIESNQQVVEAFDARHYKTIDQTATLSLELFADWGQTGSLCDSLWDATKTSPDTPLDFTFVAGATGNVSTFTGQVLPNYPVTGGGATDITMATVELVVYQGTITRA